MRDTLIGICKLCVAVLLLPIVVGVSAGFLHEAGNLKKLSDIFLCGVAAYVVTHLFIYAPQGMFQFGQKIFRDLLRFAPAVAETVPRLIPLGTLTLSLVLYILRNFSSAGWLPKYFLFFIGYTSALHIVLTARELYEQDGSPLKPHYFSLMAVVYITGLTVIAALLALNFNEFVLADYIKFSAMTAKHIYSLFGGRLFSV